MTMPPDTRPDIRPDARPDGEPSTASDVPRTTVEYPVPRATSEYPVLGDTGRPTPGAGRAVAGRGARVGLRLFGVVGLDRPHVHGAPPVLPDTDLVAYRDVGAVVEPGAYTAEPMGAVALERHRAVVDDVFARRAIVPAPPGTVFRSREALASWLELHYFTLVDALGFVEDRAAARVTVSWTATADAARRAAPLHLDSGAPAGEERAEADALVAEAAEPFRALRREAVSLLVLRADELGEPAAAYASFLVERARWAQFEQAVAREAQLRPGLELRLSGPWPPYDFVRMQFHG
ncbi:MAG: GvpL/GvpF family gas vesicle protein [Gemmatirosa sp.]